MVPVGLALVFFRQNLRVFSCLSLFVPVALHNANKQEKGEVFRFCEKHFELCLFQIPVVLLRIQVKLFVQPASGKTIGSSWKIFVFVFGKFPFLCSFVLLVSFEILEGFLIEYS
jgi:hypothetical protein